MIIVDRRDAPARWLAHLDGDPDGAIARALGPFGVLYAQMAALHRTLRGEVPLPSIPPSIAIGNPRVGGTGKTPIVHDLGRRLVERGQRVAVLSRGYRAAGGGDEPKWLADAGLQVVLGADRHASFDAARQGGADVVLLDDGLQTRARALRRLAIVLDRDLARPPRTLPAGPARENVQAAIERADGILVRRESDEAPRSSRDDGRPHVEFRLLANRWIEPDGTSVPFVPADGPSCVAVSGLARPESFESTLREARRPVLGVWRRPDHWLPTAAEIDEIESWARRLGAECIVCPEKNLARLLAVGPSMPVRALAAEVAWAVDDPLEALGITELLDTTKGDPSGPPSS